MNAFLFEIEPASKGKKVVVEQVQSMCVGGKEDAGFRKRVALGVGQAPTIFIHYYYFYGKRNLQKFRFGCLPLGIGLSNLDPMPVQHSGCS